MRPTRVNVVRVIKAMTENKNRVVEIAEQYGDKEMANDALREAMVLEDILRLFTNNDYLNKIADIYNIIE